MSITESSTVTAAPVDRPVGTPAFRIHHVETGSGHPVVLLNRCGHGAQTGHAIEFNRPVTSFIGATSVGTV